MCVLAIEHVCDHPIGIYLDDYFWRCSYCDPVYKFGTHRCSSLLRMHDEYTVRVLFGFHTC